jgi:hypothetical protein
MAEWALLAVWIVDAALVMSNRNAGFFTGHAADFAMPAWIYVVRRKARRWPFEAHPVALASIVFAASAATEISQLFWPHGPFRGAFDPLDLVAYAAGILPCCLADLRWPIPPRHPAQE